jgi:hypothetical protein
MECTRTSYQHWPLSSANDGPPSLPLYKFVSSDSISDSAARDIPVLDTIHLNEQTTLADSPKLDIDSSIQEVEEEAYIKGWPERPQKLRERTLASIVFSMSDILLTLAPTAFIGKSPVNEILNNH